MSDLGRQRIATAAQCTEVGRLAEEGLSVRKIAEEVFGDRSFRGRVERILQTAKAPINTARDSGITDGTGSVETVPAVRKALSRYLARLERGDVEPSVGEMLKLLELERRLQCVRGDRGNKLFDARLRCAGRK